MSPTACPHTDAKVLRGPLGISWNYGCPYALLRCETCGLEFYDPNYQHPYTQLLVTHRRDGTSSVAKAHYDRHGRPVARPSTTSTENEP